MPSDVPESTIAMNSGSLATPVADSASATAIAMVNETTKLSEATFSNRPRSCENSISSPARKSRNARPTTAITATGSSTSTHPSTAGPTTIPATISSTTEGSRRPGANPRTNGAAKPTATTISRFVNSSSTASAVLGVLVVELAARVPLGPLVAVRRYPAGVLDHAREVQQVPRHEGGVAVREVVVGSARVG